MAYNYDSRKIGRKLGSVGRGIFGALNSGGGAKVNPEVANLMKYGEYGNSAVDASLPVFVPSGNNILGQGSRIAEGYNNQLFTGNLNAARDFENTKALARLQKDLELESIGKKHQLTTQYENENLENQGAAIRSAVGGMDEKTRGMFDLPGPYSNASYARFAGAKFGNRLQSEGVAGIPSALAQQEGQAATAPYLPLGEGRFNPKTREYLEGGKFITNEIDSTNQFGLPEKRKITSRINPTAMTLGPITQAEIDGANGNGPTQPNFGLPNSQFNLSPQGSNSAGGVAPASSGEAPPPKPTTNPWSPFETPDLPIDPQTQATGVLPNMYRAGSKLLDKAGTVGSIGLDAIQNIPGQIKKDAGDLIGKLYTPAGGYKQEPKMPMDEPSVKPRTDQQKQKEAEDYQIEEQLRGLTPTQKEYFVRWMKNNPGVSYEQAIRGLDYIKQLDLGR